MASSNKVIVLSLLLGLAACLEETCHVDGTCRSDVEDVDAAEENSVSLFQRHSDLISEDSEAFQHTQVMGREKPARSRPARAVDVCARDFKHPEWLKSCTAIYLDIGSNMGVQVRKLYEPEKYSGNDEYGKLAEALPLFSKAFGQPKVRKAKDSGVCALGFEPNPSHRARLTKIQEAYNAKGWRTHFYPVAVWDERGSMKFNVTDDPKHADWGARIIASLLERGGWHKEDVCTIDMGAFVAELPKGSVKLAKMDIEGAEWRVIPKMLEHQQFCSNVIGEIFIETHSWGNTSTWNGDRTYNSARAIIGNRSHCAAAAPSKFIQVDDESFLLDVDSEYGIPSNNKNSRANVSQLLN